MRWLVVLPFERPGHVDVDFRDELRTMGHEVGTFAYRCDNPLLTRSIFMARALL